MSTRELVVGAAIAIVIAAGITVTVLAVASVGNKPQSTTVEGNNFEVEYLFEKDGVKVYRFLDKGHYRYFTTLGETMTVQHNGKSNCTENIK